jgi:hypothetical protein
VQETTEFAGISLVFAAQFREPFAKIMIVWHQRAS